MTTKLEQAARQIIVDWDSGIHLYEAITAMREALAEQAEQEPVAYTNIDQLGYLKDPLYENAPMAMWSKQFDERINIPLYAAPLAKQVTPVTQAVRTKDPCNTLQDLTDDEICEVTGCNKDAPLWLAVSGIARAVIAADRELNK